MPFPLHPCPSQLAFHGKGMQTALPGTGLGCCWGQALLWHTQQGGTAGQGRFWRITMGCVDIPKHSTVMGPMPHPSSQSSSADGALTATESWGGVGNKWVNQTNPRESESSLVPAQGRSSCSLSKAQEPSCWIQTFHLINTLRAKLFGFTLGSWQMPADFIMLVTRHRASLVRNSCEVVHQTLAPAQQRLHKSSARWAGSLTARKGTSPRCKSPLEHCKHWIWTGRKH